MQLPPLSSSSYTVIPEKSFHLCHTYTISNTCPHTKVCIPGRTHTHTQTLFFFLNPQHTFSSPPVSTPRQHNTVLQLPNLLFNSAYSAKPICFCTNHLLILLHSLLLLTMVLSILHILHKTPVMPKKKRVGVGEKKICHL